MFQFLEQSEISGENEIGEEKPMFLHIINLGVLEAN